jgi:D-alanyl-D-alanine carboxypeptidase
MKRLNTKQTKTLYQGVILLCAIVFVVFIFPEENNENSGVTITDVSIEQQKIDNDPFKEVFIEAKSAYVLDIKTGKVLYAKNAEAQLPLASVAKVMVALTSTRIIPDYTLISINSKDLREEGDSGLFVGEEWRLKNLLDFALMVSSNDAINSIASIAGSQIVSKQKTKTSGELFIDEMNKTAREIGLTQTYFLNGSGLDLSGGISGGYGSAEDMAKLFAYVLKEKPELLEATSYSSLTLSSNSHNHVALNTNKAINNIPNVLASKTGFTDLSGGNLVIAFDAGLMRPIVISVLGSSYDGRFTDMEKLVSTTFKKLAQ